MKNFHYITLLLSIMLFTSCETAIGVDLETASPRLVVDASINWVKGTDGSEQKIKLSTTTGYFSSAIPTVSGATVSVKNSDGTEFIFTESATAGEYVCNNFIPTIGETYTLTILHNNQLLTATETLKAVPIIDKIEQKIQSGIGSEEDRIDIKTFFTDPGSSADFYMTRVQTNINAIPEFTVTDDQFFQGNQIFDLYINEDIRPGNVLDIKLYGISQRYYNYMLILTSIAGNAGGGPFATPPATLRGNVINLTNQANYVLGYFSLSEVDRKVYVVY